MTKMSHQGTVFGSTGNVENIPFMKKTKMRSNPPVGHHIKLHYINVFFQAQSLNAVCGQHKKITDPFFSPWEGPKHGINIILLSNDLNINLNVLKYFWSY